jgi:hypothetical protein
MGQFRTSSIVTALSLALSLLGSPALAAGAGPVAVANGRPSCWGATGGAAVLTPVAGYAGRTAVQVRGRSTNTTAVEWDTDHATGCGTPVTPQRQYTIGAWYQASSMVQPVVYTYSRAAGWKKWFTAPPYSGSTPWSRIEATTPVVPAGAEQIGLGFGVGPTAKLVLDDVSVQDATAVLGVAGRSAAFTASFANNTALVTNEYAYWNPAHMDAARSPIWTMTSGSLFNQAGAGYTGKIQEGRVDAKSAVSTDSSVFRLQTVRKDFADVTVAFKLTVAELASTKRTPAVSYDGVHIWLRYQTQYNLYAASVARRDGKVVIKKKCPGGPSNDGTYYTLGKEIPGAPIHLGTATPVSASVRNNPSGTVTIALSVNGRVLVSAVDTGVGCPVISAPGAVGIRGDNTRFSFTGFSAISLS